MREIFRLVVLADELVRHVEHLPPILANDEIPGGLIALQAALNESLDGVRLICRHEASSALVYDTPL